jgi:hypothetical protein
MSPQYSHFIHPFNKLNNPIGYAKVNFTTPLNLKYNTAKNNIPATVNRQ